MNNSIPGWDFESDTSFINHQKNHQPIGHDQELVELLWQNGQVVLQSQTQRKPIQKTDASSSSALSHQQQDETSSWIQFPLIEDPLFEQQQEELICSNNFSQFSPCEVVEPYKPTRSFQESKFAKFDATLKTSIMPAPRFHHVPDSSHKINDFGSRSQKVPKFSHFGEKANNANIMSQSEAKECSVMTIGSSHCGSNQILQDQDVSKVSSSGVWAATTTATATTTFSAEHEALRDCSAQRSVPWSVKGKPEMMIEPTVTSSSGGSGSSSLGKTCSLSTGNHGLKRKGTIDAAEESEEQSEATETKSAAANKASQRSGSSRRNRAAEVHNLSERRRRDRINEKMKTLQQLIPNSNKTDKASMLDEAIEYLKSLQLQLQVMWMGGSMAPMMFPGIQHYMSQMSMGNMAAPTLPPIQNPMQLPRMPLDQSMPLPQPLNQNLMCQNPVLGAFSNYQNQLQNSCLAEQYARYIGYHHLMQSASQPMNVFGYGSQALQHSQTITPPTNSSGPMSGAPSFDDATSGKMGSSTFEQDS